MYHHPIETASVAAAIAREIAPPAGRGPIRIILSFDVEEHDRIESASGLSVSSGLREDYADRVAPATRWILEALAESGALATFFVLGQVARRDPSLVREIADAGHEVASHGWDHKRILQLTPAQFAEDLRLSKDALEQAAGAAVVGYRAPTFSLVRRTAWALDVMAEAGLLYDSSIYPVRHDRYGVPNAPRAPFLARGVRHAILEIPPATLRVGRAVVPVGGGGYFRLFPLAVMERALAQAARECSPAVAMLYFHPWEFDPDQPRLPLRGVNRFRTYVGLRRSRGRLRRLLAGRQFTRAVDVARSLDESRTSLPEFDPAA